ncbi:MAG: hypothetical protein D6737_17345 [Chloroflexi bacterium]|nr:MAG: hypothetical protein D6737_17345 [Chloroflexota bacterium]
MTTSYQPIQQYQHLIGQNGVQPTSAQMALQAIDVFIMKQIAACYPQPPTIIDLAANHTNGASTILWLANAAIDHIFVLANHDNTNNTAQWQKQFHHALSLMELETAHLSLINEALPNGRERIENEMNPLTPVFFILAATDAAQFESQVKLITGLWDEALILFLPLGASGQSLVLEAALRFCRQNDAYQFSAIREWSPFWSSSQLGIIHHQSQTDVTDVLKRIQQLYIGNDDFLSLLRMKAEYQIQEHPEKLLQHENMLLGASQQVFAINDESTDSVPEPLISGRLIQQALRRMIPVEKQPSLKTSNQFVIRSIRNAYHFMIPTPIRILLRNIRVKLIGM